MTLRLDAFRDGGCPIQYFIIEYRRESEHNFKLVASNVSARESARSIEGLEPATRYYIRVTAFNAAGGVRSERETLLELKLYLTISCVMRGMKKFINK